MRILSRVALLLAFVPLIPLGGHGQSGDDAINVRVEVTTTKKQYVVGEPIVFRVVLVNRGPMPVYVPKSFEYKGGGIPGFAVQVKQLTGKPAKLGCGMAAGDAFGLSDLRSPEQILKEEYLKLSPGDLVGFEDEYRGCGIENAGHYEITANYSPSNLSQEKVEKLVLSNAKVLSGIYHSSPYTFSVRPRQERH